MSDKTRTCIVCGTKYEYCLSCKSGTKDMPAWKMIYHDDNCRKIWHTITTFYDVNGADKTVKELDKLDLSDISKFNEGVRNKINKIKSEAKPKTVIKKENKEDNISE